jgi:Ner family transcriptional regulator
MAAHRWHREDIKAELRKQFGNLTTLSVSWGFHRSSISNALERAESPRVDQRIAEALKVPLHELWPERWNRDGSRIRRSPIGTNPSPSVPASHRQKSEAA